MPLKLLLTLALTGAGLASAISVNDIPALPPGVTAPPPRSVPVTPAPVTPSAPVTPPASSTVGPSSLPVGPALGQPHRATLVGPSSLVRGTAGTWTLQLTNTGETPIHLEHGACDLKFEVLNAAGEIVRPAVTNTICTQQLVITDVAPGETEDVLSLRWDGRDASGRPLPAGTYTLRAAFWDRSVSLRPPAVTVTLR
ncbi:FlgD immunoglobulin-like domain containing protein [Deinococcus sp. YIM 77859]|uniref:FlgD immunoglobulin-like domain containing protein n=1 Tax=Deinococcus sp. YIM 77859 TaxID=1540221 RepID=UPI0005591D0F|nr:FlgD immunoglobulin-like domain containing protein [Deinococcus sp. YIM 77859]